MLAIFLGGLGAGGLLLGRRADRSPRPILLYSQLEVIVAVSAAISPLLLALVRELYIALGGTQQLGLGLGTVGRLVLSAAVLAVPTIAMGGTLPAAARGVTRHTDARRQDVAALYALNTLGAVTGCLVATFFMLEIFGTRTTLWLAAGVNLLVAMVARQVDRSAPPLGDPAGVEVAPGGVIEPGHSLRGLGARVGREIGGLGEEGRFGVRRVIGRHERLELGAKRVGQRLALDRLRPIAAGRRGKGDDPLRRDDERQLGCAARLRHARQLVGVGKVGGLG